MKLLSFFKKPPGIYALLVMILCLGVTLRMHNYTTWPREGATFDEFAWSFLGMSIIETGIPTSWSPHDEYHTRTFFRNTDGASFFLVTPYLEHPPLFGIIAGGYARFAGMKEFNDVSIERIRLLGILMGIASMIALYLFVKESIDTKTALFAIFIYSIMPSVVIGSRLVQNENFFIPVSLLSLYSVMRYVKRNQRVYLLISILLAAILPLAKVPWIAGAAAVFGILLYFKKYREAVFLVFTTIAFFSLFILYGLRLDSEVFIKLWQLQLARYDMGYDTFFTFFRDPIITDRFFLDGLVYLGFLGLLFVYGLKNSNHIPAIFGFLAYFFIFLFAIPNEPGHGWYRFPLYPYLAIFIAITLKEAFNKNMAVTSLGLLIPGLAAFSMSWQQAFGFSYGIYRSFLVACAFGLLTYLIPYKRFFAIAKVVNIFVAFFVVILVIWSGVMYNEQ